MATKKRYKSLKKVGNTGNFNGVEITEDNTQEVLDSLEASVKRAFFIIGSKAEKYAKALCPVGTPESVGVHDKNGKLLYPRKGYMGGTLRNSITWEYDDSNDEQTVYVGSNVEYAPYVELGTGPNFEPPEDWVEFHVPMSKGVGHGYVKPRKFLQPAILDHRDHYKQVLESELKKG